MTQTFLDRLGLTNPILLAPMAGGTSTPALAAAVSEAGGLGSLGCAYLQPEQIVVEAERLRALTERPFALNLFMAVEPGPADLARVELADRLLQPFRDAHGVPAANAPPGGGIDLEAQLQAVERVRPAVFSSTFGRLPAERVRRFQDLGMVVVGTATTVAEALLLESDGVDAIVAQGAEAGGHRGTFLGPFEQALIGTMALVPAIAARVRVPVIASGGIMNGAGIAAALALGASAVQMGTAFLVCPESGAAAVHKQAVLAAQADDTVVTPVYSGRHARGIRNKLFAALDPHREALPGFPAMNDLTRALRAAGGKAGDREVLALWSGQGAALARAMPAAELMATLLAELEAA